MTAVNREMPHREHFLRYIRNVRSLAPPGQSDDTVTTLTVVAAGLLAFWLLVGGAR